MTRESFRFIHASDFHLEKPLQDLNDLPKHLREAIAEAPWKAAEAVFEAALVENVDFLLLAGDLLSPSQAGPRGMAFLLDSFDQLAERKIDVYWAAGNVDAAHYWPEAIPLPDNVTMLPKGRAAQLPINRADHAIATLVGRSGDGNGPLHVPSYRVDPTDQFTIGLGFGQADADALAELRFDYWALGGRHSRHHLADAAEQGAHYCGSPQGRSIQESGPHGFYLVDVDADGSTRMHDVDVDEFRFCKLVIDSAEMQRGTNLRQLLSARFSRLLTENGKRHLLVAVDLQPAHAESLEMVGDPAELLVWLRREFGSGSPAAWTLRVDVQAPSRYPKPWQEEDTILGDFLRAAERHRKNAGRDLNLLPVTEEHAGLPSTATTLLAEAEPECRAALLGSATLLGAELLRGGKPRT